MSKKRNRFWLINFEADSTRGSRTVATSSGVVDFEKFEKATRPAGSRGFIITAVIPLDPCMFRSLRKMYRCRASATEARP